MAEREALTAEYVRQILHYDPETGEFRWREQNPPNRGRGWNRHRPGSLAGGVCKDGYLIIKIRGASYKAHRLVWLYMTGSWPLAQIDHINLDKSDNRFVNLREATCAQNRANTRAYQSSTSKVKGVRWNKSAKKWEARIRKDRVLRYIGVFDDINEASSAYADAALRLFGEFARAE